MMTQIDSCVDVILNMYANLSLQQLDTWYFHELIRATVSTFDGLMV